MTQPLYTVRQVAYVVRDMEKALKYWTEYLKVGPFFVLEHAPLENQKYRGGASNADISIALGNSGVLMNCRLEKSLVYFLICITYCLIGLLSGQQKKWPARGGPFNLWALPLEVIGSSQKYLIHSFNGAHDVIIATVAIQDICVEI